MKTATAKRHYPVEFAYGQRMGRRLHCGSSNISVIRYVHSIYPKHPRRKALYLGAIDALKRERDMMRRFRL